MDIIFKQYTSRDTIYRQAWNLRQAILRTPVGLHLTEQDHQQDQIDRHFCLCLKQQLLATVSVEVLEGDPESPRLVKLRQMVVSPDYQKQGLGRLLIEKTEQALRKQFVESIHLAARLPAVGFYQKLGYNQYGPIYHHLRIDHRDMVKTL